MLRFVIMFFVAFSALSCDRKDAQPDRKPPQTNVWQGQIKTIDKARAVQQTVDGQADAQRKQIDDQTQ